jgi:hypothetical protein
MAVVNISSILYVLRDEVINMANRCTHGNYFIIPRPKNQRRKICSQNINFTYYVVTIK